MNHFKNKCSAFLGITRENNKVLLDSVSKQCKLYKRAIITHRNNSGTATYTVKIPIIHVITKQIGTEIITGKKINET